LWNKCQPVSSSSVVPFPDLDMSNNKRNSELTNPQISYFPIFVFKFFS
jgi:hypothetical protein